jgi:hypothetical protein
MNECKCACHSAKWCNCACHREPKYREGQTVRIVWPNGTLIEGVLSQHLAVACPPTGYTFYVQDGAYTKDGRVVTILSEPPTPKEPYGNGAVVRNSRGFNFVKNGKWWFDRFGNKFEWVELVHTDFLEILSEGV